MNVQFHLEVRFKMQKSSYTMLAQQVTSSYTCLPSGNTQAGSLRCRPLRRCFKFTPRRGGPNGFRLRVEYVNEYFLAPCSHHPWKSGPLSGGSCSQRPVPTTRKKVVHCQAAAAHSGLPNSGMDGGPLQFWRRPTYASDPEFSTHQWYPYTNKEHTVLTQLVRLSLVRNPVLE
jgi:hypothetical protein